MKLIAASPKSSPCLGSASCCTYTPETASCCTHQQSIMLQPNYMQAHTRMDRVPHQMILSFNLSLLSNTHTAAAA
jgi:hypothetical protein